MLRSLFIYVLIIGATLGACEVVLAIRDPSILRLELSEKNMMYQYDHELGWFPKQNYTGKFTATRTIVVHNNNLGFRDRPPRRDGAKTILIIGDSFVWGYDAEEDERFTDLLKRDWPNVQIVNAGVSGYGTDQEYLLLTRIWNDIKPDVVLLIFCTNNDRLDNSTNVRYGGYYKPYYSVNSGRFEGTPVPKTRLHFFSDTWLSRNSRLTRLVISLWLAATLPPEIHLPDPTDYLVDLMRQLVESHGSKFAVGLQRHDPALEAHLRAQGVPYTSFDDAAHYPSNGKHWTPEGHDLVASRLRSMLVDLRYLSSE